MSIFRNTLFNRVRFATFGAPRRPRHPFLRSKDGWLVCAAHGASFELANGTCVAGPCRGEALRAVEVHCVDGEVRLSLP